MKKIMLLVIVFVFASALVSSEVLFLQEPNSEYYFGDFLKNSVKVFADSPISSVLESELVCGSKVVFSEEKFIFLNLGEEEIVTTTIPLLRKYISKSSGECFVRSSIEGKQISSDKFILKGDLEIVLDENFGGKDFAPGEVVRVSGSVLKSNSEKVYGSVSFSFEKSGKTFSVREVVNEGRFDLSFKLPEDNPAGYYSGKLVVGEKDYLGDLSTEGVVNYSFYVKQIERNLEILLEKNEVIPGEDFLFRVKLHDQTGENIPTDVVIVMKDFSGKEIFKKNVGTEEEGVYRFGKDQIPSRFILEVRRGEIYFSKEVFVLENREIFTEIVDGNLVIKNVGNVFFEGILPVKISDTEKEISVSLGIGQQAVYSLFAPDGVYEVGVGEKIVSGVFLTGDAINIKKVSGKVVNFIANPLVWIFILIVVIGFVYVVYSRTNKKQLFGRVYTKAVQPSVVEKNLETKKIFPSRYVAKNVLSLKGDEQNIVGIFLKIKNFKECLKDKDSQAFESAKEISSISERFKASVYESEENILFLFAPAITKKFQNEKSALEFSMKLKEKIDSHNKLFKQKIEYGIGIVDGKIVGKVVGGNGIEFFTKDNFVNLGKKLSDLSKGELIFGEGLRAKLMKDAIFKKHVLGNLNYFSLEEIKRVSEGRERVNEIVRKMGKRG